MLFHDKVTRAEKSRKEAEEAIEEAIPPQPAAKPAIPDLGPKQGEETGYIQVLEHVESMLNNVVLKLSQDPNYKGYVYVNVLWNAEPLLRIYRAFIEIEDNRPAIKQWWFFDFERRVREVVRTGFPGYVELYMDLDMERRFWHAYQDALDLDAITTYDVERRFREIREQYQLTQWQKYGRMIHDAVMSLFIHEVDALDVALTIGFIVFGKEGKEENGMLNRLSQAARSGKLWSSLDWVSSKAPFPEKIISTPDWYKRFKEGVDNLEDNWGWTIDGLPALTGEAEKTMRNNLDKMLKEDGIEDPAARREIIRPFIAFYDQEVRQLFDKNKDLVKSTETATNSVWLALNLLTADKEDVQKAVNNLDTIVKGNKDDWTKAAQNMNQLVMEDTTLDRKSLRGMWNDLVGSWRAVSEFVSGIWSRETEAVSVKEYEIPRLEETIEFPHKLEISREAPGPAPIKEPTPPGEVRYPVIEEADSLAPETLGKEEKLKYGE